MYAPTIAPRYAPIAPTGYSAPTGTELWDVLSALSAGQGYDFYQGGGVARAPGQSPLGFAPRVDLLQQVQAMRQGLHQREAVGQRAGMNFGRTELDGLQARVLLELFLVTLMLGALRAAQAEMARAGSSEAGTSGGGGGSETASPAGSAPVNAPAPSTPNGSGSLTAAELRRIAPQLSETRAAQLLPNLNRAMQEANIKTPRQQAAFVAQLAQESGGFRWFEELASGQAYEGRRDLGNTQPGDGVRYKGRGPIQLTGRANYRAAGKALGLDLEGHPELVANPEVGFRVAAWYWNNRNLNEPAERGDFREVTRRINGGYNGYEARLAYYRTALQVLT
ncbi:MAG: glycoside hydrolase family 19 protein [Deltaproteobacteria bacterium]|nr:glycoside hydrolase family 19 protein [Deltaproteobacteria bacterium]